MRLRVTTNEPAGVDKSAIVSPGWKTCDKARILLEHLLIGELLKHSWLHHGAELEVSQPVIDRSGHDVVLEANGITRHVQLKASASGASTSVSRPIR
jgi:hypothetical protein